MDIDILANPRVQELLAQAANADSLRATLSAQGERVDEVDEAMATIYRDMGALVHALVREASRIEADDVDTKLDELDVDGGFTNEIADFGEERWYTEEEEDPDRSPLFSASDLLDLDDHTEVPEAEPGAILERLDIPEDESNVEDDMLTTIEHMQVKAATPGTDLAELRNADRRPTWAYHLDDFLQLLSLPEDWSSTDELATEASRVQWGATELPSRSSGLPASIQACLVGLLGARAQHLRAELDVGVGPRLALDRLIRYRVQAALPSVNALAASPRPENGSWSSDAQGWWALLAPDQGP
jgi:hypothetical protein